MQRAWTSITNFPITQHSSSKRFLLRTLLNGLHTTASRSAVTKLLMPAMSPTMTEGAITSWKIKEGDSFSAGDVLLEIETDKAQIDVEAQDDGYLAKIVAPAGGNKIAVNELIALLAEEGDTLTKEDLDLASKEPSESSSSAETAEKKLETAEKTQQSPQAPTKKESAPSVVQDKKSTMSQSVFFPSVARLIAEHDLDPTTIEGTGPKGRLLKGDVLKVLTTGARKQAPSTTKAGSAVGAEYTEIPLTNMRKVIAERLTSSKQAVPHYYLTIEIEMDKLLRLREVLNKEAEKGAPRLSVNDFIVKASASALKAVPEANSAWNKDSIRQYHHADICVATSTPGGLITPIVRRADTLGLSTISSAVRDLAGRAREGKLQPHEYQGGSFTISNLGMFDIDRFTAIINPPQACILAIGTTEKKIFAAPKESGRQFEERTVMAATLSCDHRVVDGAVGATWLKAFKGFMEQPLTMLL